MTFDSHAGTGAIPSGPNIKLLKDNLRFKSTDTKIMTNDSDDPTVVAKSAEIGSIYIRSTTGTLYQKMDSGSSTNWQALLIGGVGLGTDNHLSRWDGTGSPSLQDSLAILDDLGGLSGLTQLDVDNVQINGNTISTTNLNGDLLLAPNGTGEVNISKDLTVEGNFTVNGTTTTINSTTLEVADQQILVNKGGTQASADINDAGILVEMSDATDAGLFYDSTLTSKFMVGEVGSSVEIVTVSGAQSITAKTLLEVDNLRLDGNTISSTSGDIILDATSNINLPDLTASTPLKLDASKNIISADLDLTTDVTGVLPIANGGTNSSTALNNGRLMLSSAGSIVEASALTNGQLFIGSTGLAPVASALTGTVNQISVTNGAGSITLATPQDIHTGASPTFLNGTFTNNLDVVANFDVDGVTTLDNTSIQSVDGNPALSVSSTVSGTGLLVTESGTNAGISLTSSGGGNALQVNATALVVDPSNNVGIGIASPTETLEVVGSAKVDNVKVDGNTISSTDTNGDLTLSPNGTGEVVVTSPLQLQTETTPSTPSAGSFKTYFKDSELKYLSSDGKERPVDTGKDLDIFFDDNIEINKSADWTCGNNATFLGGGTVQGTLSDDTTTPLNGSTSLLFTQVAGSTNDYCASPAFSIKPKVVGQWVGVTLYNTYSGSDDDVKLVVYDGSSVLGSALDTIKLNSNPTRSSYAVFIPLGTTSLRYGFQVVSATNTAVFELDDVVFSLNPFNYKELMVNQYGKYNVRTGFGSTATFIPYFTNQNYLTGDNIVTVGNDSTNGFSLTAIKDCSVTMTFQAVYTGTGEIFGLSKNASSLTTSVASLVGSESIAYADDSGRIKTVTATVDLKQGEIFRPHVGTTANLGNANDWSVSFHAQAVTEHVITPMTDSTLPTTAYTPTFEALGTVSNVDVFYKKVDDVLFIRGFTSAGTVTASDVTISLPSGYEIDYNNASVSSRNPLGYGIRHNTAVRPAGEAAQNSIIFADGVATTKVYISRDPFVDATSFPKSTGSGTFSNNDGFSFWFQVPVKTDRSQRFLAAIPIEQVVVIKHVETSGTGGGTLTAATWNKRTLNTVEGSSSVVSLSSSEFTLQKGHYYIEAKVPAYRVADHQARILSTDSSIKIVGSPSYANPSANSYDYSFVQGFITLTASKAFKVEHNINTSNGASDGGRPASFDDEVYTQVTIRKLR